MIDIRKISLMLLLGFGAVWQPVLARGSTFVAYAEPLRVAVATHALELQLQAVTLASDSDRQIAGKHATENQFQPLLMLFAGSLAEADPRLLRGMEQRLRAVDRRAGEGDFKALENAIRDVREDLAKARKRLVPEAVAGRTEFKAAVIAKLAVSRLGFAEAYEAAAKGESGAYRMAWLTLQRVDTLWNELKPALPLAETELQPILQELTAVMPSAQMPAELGDPERVEVAALDLVFALERGLARPLLARGFEPQLKLAEQQADQACSAAARGQRRFALENALAGRYTYNAELGSTVAVVAPDLAVVVKDLWVQLAGNSDVEGATPENCASMRQAMTQVGKALAIRTTSKG